MNKATEGCLLPAAIVFVIFFMAAIIFNANYDSNQTEYKTIKGITPMMITPLTGTLERQFGYDMSERETVTGATIYTFTKGVDKIELTTKYEMATEIGLGLLILKNYYPEDGSISDAAKYLATEIVSLPYQGSKPDSARQWMETRFTKVRGTFSAGDGEFRWSDISVGENGKKLSLRGVQK